MAMLFLGAGLLVSERLHAGWTASLRASLLDISGPALEAVSSSPLSKLGAPFANLRDATRLWAVNGVLREENERLSRWYGEAARLEAENRALRQLLRVPVADDKKYITSAVMGDSGRAFARAVLVAVGREHGIMPGFIALTERGVVGRIVEAGARSSRVLLLTDINSRVPVYVGTDRLPAILIGQNDRRPILGHLPDGAEIPVGAAIFTSGAGGAFSPWLPVGTVQAIEAEGIRVALFAFEESRPFLLLTEPRRLEESASAESPLSSAAFDPSAPSEASLRSHP